VTGFGEDSPVAPNDTPPTSEERARDRDADQVNGRRAMLAGLIPNRAVTWPSPRLRGRERGGAARRVKSAGGAIPSPPESAARSATAWTERGCSIQLSASFRLEVAALACRSACALALAYLTVRPRSAPSSRRYGAAVHRAGRLGLRADAVCVGGRQLELWMLVFGIAPYFVTAVRRRSRPAATAVRSRPARSAAEWRVAWEVVVRGTVGHRGRDTAAVAPRWAG